MKRMITTMARAGGWLAKMRLMRVLAMLLLALMMLPQQVAANDYEWWYLPNAWRTPQNNNIVYYGDDPNMPGLNPFINYGLVFHNSVDTDYGFIDTHGGANVYMSKDNGASWVQVFHIRASKDGDWVAWGSDSHGGNGLHGYDNPSGLSHRIDNVGTFIYSSYGAKENGMRYISGNLYLDNQWRNCNILLASQGYWSKWDGSEVRYFQEIASFTTDFALTVRQIYWNGDFTVAADGTVTMPYIFGDPAYTDGETYLTTRINGVHTWNIPFKYLNGNYEPGTYTFNLSDIGADMRSQFTLEPYHQFKHDNDKDANYGVKYYTTYPGGKIFYAMPLATLSNPVFSQLNHNITLNWTADNTNYGNGRWVIYRNGVRIEAVPENIHTYTDTGFQNESNVSYCVYYVANGWDESVQRSELKSSDVWVNTTRTVPMNVPNATSQNDRIVFTWMSDGYPASWGNYFNIYIDNVLAYTLTPADYQTSFRWEHRTTDQHTDRQNKIDGTIPYTEEPLNACTPHTYRIDGVINGKVLNSMTFERKAIGTGTRFYAFDATKGAYPGMVKLNWHVDRQGSTAAKTYIVDRRRTEKGDEPWVTLYRTSSDEDYLMYTDDTPLPGIYYDYRVTVQDKCSDGTIITNETTDIGFAQTTGTMSGRITFGATGSSVANVDVEARRIDTSDNAEAQYHAMRFTASYGLVYWPYPSSTYAVDKFATGDFTIQMWVNPETIGESMLVSLNEWICYIGMNASGQLRLIDNGGWIYTFENAVLKAGQYNHVVLTRKGSTVTGSVVDVDAAGIPVLNSSTKTLLVDNLNVTDAFQLSIGNFVGYVDEFRLWTKALTEAEILENYDHLLVGNEKQLETYWTFDEGLRTQFFDYSRDGSVYHQHHGHIWYNAEPSNLTPPQLKLKAKTDRDGNYIIQGVPFQGEGTTYAVIPTLGIHQFNPTQHLRFVSNNSLVHNGTDFTDISSFPVRGTIRYAGTDYPVEGVNFYVDGQICAKEGQPITTNAYGEYEISVPIGEHYITVAKQGHEFANGGRYPADPNGLSLTHTFDQKITGLEFIDETLVNFTGRVVGGSIEGEKPVGFGLSQNNIGVVELVLSPQNELYRMNVVKKDTETTSSLETNTEEVTVPSATDAIQSNSVRGATADFCKKIFIRTDPATGEFSAMLPPLQYKLESMKVVKSQQDVGAATVIDLTNSQRTQTDSVRNENGELLEYEYNTMLKQIYHSEPSFSVTQKGSEDGHFGIETYKITDELGDIDINDIYSVDSDGKITYKYGGAVFVKDDPYTFLLSGYEEYTNSDQETPIVSRVPLSGVVVTINNALSDGQSVYAEGGEVSGKTVKAGDVVELQSNQMVLDDEGCGTYTWCAGLPNISEPYTRTINMSYAIDGRTYQWSGNGMTGVILGEMPTGNNFVTAGPDQLLMVLRDPPGSESSAEWSTGSSTTISTTKGNTFSESFQTTNTFKFGYKEGIITGTPAVGTISTVDSDNDLTVGVVEESEGENSHSSSATITVTKTVATKGMGDVFIGNATNIIFGKARMLNFHRTSGNSVALGLNDIMTTGLRFGTAFNYSLTYIEETLLPNWEKMRNQFLTHVESQSDINSYVNNTDASVYLTTLTKDDKDFGKTGTYTQFAPKNMAADSLVIDSVRWVNTQIDNWKEYLAFNEKEKVLAFEYRGQNVMNYSFDSGADVNYSIETETSSVSTWEWTVSAGAVVGDNFGFEVKGLGFEINIEAQAMGGRHEVHETEDTNTSSFSFTLAEKGDYDALSVDVYSFGAFSPIFRTRGGQTSDPYEGEVRTTYYEDKNGSHPVIMEATMQIEVPQIDVDEPVVSDIPSGSAANYVLKLSNASEIGADVAYRIGFLNKTNPKGAQLMMDGKVIPSLEQGRLIKVPGNQTLTKALQLRQTDLGVLDYDNIAIVFASDSEPDNIADTVYISAHFTPSSSAVNLALSNTIMNTQTGTNLKLTFNNFDRNYKNLKAFRLQYKKQGSTDWTLLHEYVLDETAVTQNNELLPAGAEVDYTLPMNQFTDGDYLFRVLSVATYGSGEVYRSSEELSMVKDMQRPRPLGQPEPGDGILSAGDELSVTFNETILKGELTQAANFKVTGVLNGAKVAHETALSLQNTAAAAQTEASINLAGKDFSIDTWLNLSGGAGTLFSHGKNNVKMMVGTDSQNHLVVNIGSETYTSENTIPTDAWVFLTMSYGAGKLSASVANDATTTPLFNELPVTAYEGDGPLTVGKNMTGAMHELLLWDVAHDMTEALLQRSRTKNPATRHLIGYWKMDEGEGTTIHDYARNRHMTMSNETWYLNNVNKAVSLADGKYLSVDASALPVCSEDDYALEFWMRGDTQSAAQLLQMGQVGLWLNTDGELLLTGKGAYLDTEAQTSLATSSGKLTDNAWHHIALNVLRQGAAAVYVDGVRRLTTNAANVGSIATDNLLMGAHRRTISEHGEYSYDRPFNGQIDELRVWNATLNADKLLSNRKVRLTGSEDGLVAYYPFETKQLDEYGIVETVGTDADLCGSGYKAQFSTLNSELCTINYVDNAPALRTKPTETNVPFTFVASNEKIVITINEDPATIEGCTLNFTVRDVRDENGNYSVPAVWSAYINQNQLVWSDNNLNAELVQTTATTISTYVVNNGGQQQMWTLSGMPAWLEANVVDGETNPLSQTKVDFNVLPSAPLGRNEVTVYLRGNDNIDVPLTLNITVTGNVPDWAVNPYDYESSMNIIGVVKKGGVPLSDPDDMLAAFIGDECRGVAHLEYNATYGNYYVTMDIYGNSDDGANGGKEISFRAYDASTGTVYPEVTWTEANTCKYNDGELLGSFADPKVFNIQDKIEQEIALKAGWNWISFNVTADNMTVPELFKTIADDVVTVKSQSKYKSYENGTWGGNLTGNLSNTAMYAVKMKADRKLRIVGTSVNEDVPVYNGWTWMGYYGCQVASLGDALADMEKVNGDFVKAQRGVAYWDGTNSQWMGSLLIMEPGKGYQVKSNAVNQKFRYPSAVVSSSRSLAPNYQETQSTKAFTPVDFHNYPDNAIMAARLVANGSPVSNTELAVFAGEECRSTATTNTEGIVYLTIPGDEACELTFKVAIGNEVVVVPHTLNYETDAIFGTPANPLVIDLGSTTGVWENLNGTRIETIYDLSGRKIDHRKMQKGVYIINGQQKIVK